MSKEEIIDKYKTLKELQQENKQLKEQLEYLRSNKYLNQVKWERNFNEELVKDLQQENKQLKEEIEEYKRIEQEDLIAFNNYDSILTELEEWLKEQLMYFCENNEQGGFSTNVEDLEMILDKIQELKEKYK